MLIALIVITIGVITTLSVIRHFSQSQTNNIIDNAWLDDEDVGWM